MQKNRLGFILLSTSIVLILAATAISSFFTLSLSQISEQVSEKIKQKSQKCLLGLELLNSGISNNENDAAYNLFEQEKIGLYLFENDSLVFWNNSQIPLLQDKTLYPRQQGLSVLSYGTYLYFKSVSGNKGALALCVLKPKYDLQNNYLKNDFEEWVDIPKGISLNTKNLSEYIVTLNNEAIFSLQGSETYYHKTSIENLSTVLFLIGFLCLLLFCLIKINLSPNTFHLLIWLLLPIILRVVFLWLRFPAFISRSILYDVRLFGNAQSYINGYLGDILLNAILFLFVSLALYLRLGRLKKAWQKYSEIITLGILSFVVFNQFNANLSSLVTNSTLSFDFVDIFNFKPVSFLAIAALCFYALALFISVYKLSKYFGKKLNDYLIFIMILVSICLLERVLAETNSLFLNYWFIGFAFVLFILRQVNFTGYLILAIQLLIICLVTSKTLTTFIDKNQKKDLEILSLKLGERQDPVLENEFQNIAEKVKKDEGLNNLISLLPGPSVEVGQLLREKFFNEYFNRYNVDFSLFDENCLPLLPNKQAILLNEGFFEDQIKYNSDSTIVSDLFFVKNYKRNSRYIGKIKLNTRYLYVFMEPKQYAELGSFPDLLLDQSQQKQEKLKNFSWAVYRSQQNTNRYGNFNYPLLLPQPQTLALQDLETQHQYYSPDESTQIIFSTGKKKWNYFFTFNSYLLLFFSFITFCAYLIYTALFTTQFQTASLTRRIQIVIIVLLLLAMSAVGLTSGRLVSRQFTADNKKQLKEKADIIINELNSQFKSADLFDESQKEIVSTKLNEYARLFNSDISLFNKNGFLFNSSQPRLYSLGLTASLANPVAYSQLSNNLSSGLCLEEKAGTMNYLSFYTPLHDGDKRITGFINLPYFAKQGDLVNELSGIISALINVYVILFVLSILAGLILSGYITRPLRLIKQQIAGVSLGAKNEKISWQSNDEIGSLVSEYNQMLVKLEQSAGLLAQSEREGAWREMAKQVAHEIKNPLTPMKLNLQYLQHLLKSDPKAFAEKFGQSSAGIIEQIDALANIASEFSNFAKLPLTQLQKINLTEIIKTAVHVFEGQKTVSIINLATSGDVFVMGDKDQCLRVFNNMLKNSMQALEDRSNPAIEISLSQGQNKIIVAVKDNGCGIDEYLKPKIFSPSFTTKSTGSGLGLAIVKNILEGFGGKVSFESEKNKGSTFYLEFKSAD